MPSSLTVAAAVIANPGDVTLGGEWRAAVSPLQASPSLFTAGATVTRRLAPPGVARRMDAPSVCAVARAWPGACNDNGNHCARYL